MRSSFSYSVGHERSSRFSANSLLFPYYYAMMFFNKVLKCRCVLCINTAFPFFVF